MSVTFHFVNYTFDAHSGIARFVYRIDTQRFEERIDFGLQHKACNKKVLDSALFLAFLLIGTSYYKTFPSPDVVLDVHDIDEWQARFFSTVYQEGLSQYAYENELKREELAQFKATASDVATAQPFDGSGVVALQSGGKDSLLTAQLLRVSGTLFTPWYVSSGSSHPQVLDTFDEPLRVVTRTIDRVALQDAAKRGGRNGHVPVTYIVLSLALIDAILLGKDTVVVSIGHEGDEPHAMIGDLPVNHQWSKTWPAEQMFAEYVSRYISQDISIGSPLRMLSELRIAELFVAHAWPMYGTSFSSCNSANYQQGADNQTLTWCGVCPKCANSLLLFAPFVSPDELTKLSLPPSMLQNPDLSDTFKGLLGIDDVMKPFECVGEVEELRAAYHLARRRYGDVYQLPFEVPASSFDHLKHYPAQTWAHGVFNSL